MQAPKLTAMVHNCHVHHPFHAAETACRCSLWRWQLAIFYTQLEIYMYILILTRYLKVWLQDTSWWVESQNFVYFTMAPILRNLRKYRPIVCSCCSPPRTYMYTNKTFYALPLHKFHLQNEILVGFVCTLRRLEVVM